MASLHSRFTRILPTGLLLVALSSCAAISNDGGVLSGGAVSDSDWKKTVQSIKKDVVKIQVTGCDFTGSGSGFFAQNWLITNRHVLEDASSAYFKIAGVKHVLKGWYLSKTDDLALAPIQGSDVAEIKLGSADPIPGDLVAAAGFPWGGPQVSNFGRITGQIEEKTESSLSFVLETNLDIHPGNSGGPLVNVHGQVVGVMFAIDTLSNATLAIPLSRLKANIERAHSEFSPKSSC